LAAGAIVKRGQEAAGVGRKLGAQEGVEAGRLCALPSRRKAGRGPGWWPWNLRCASLVRLRGEEKLYGD
jgi:hypothetical protein